MNKNIYIYIFLSKFKKTGRHEVTRNLEYISIYNSKNTVEIFNRKLNFY